MTQSNKLKGWIYVISNKAMPGLVKVGYSTKDPKLRAEDLNHTGSPHPYRVEYEMLIEEPYQIERNVHKILLNCKEGKEWFRCSIEDAILAIKKIADTSIIYEKVIFEGFPATQCADRKNEGGDAQPERGAHDHAGGFIQMSLPNDKRQNNDSSVTKNAVAFVIPSVNSFKSVEGVQAVCANCGTSYSVTLRRYETKSTCPLCLRYHRTDVDWK
jgi:hypothetical protein